MYWRLMEVQDTGADYDGYHTYEDYYSDAKPSEKITWRKFNDGQCSRLNGYQIRSSLG